MLTVHPQKYMDKEGNKISVVQPIREYELLLEELEEMEDLELYDMPKKEDRGERISFYDYLKTSENKNAYLI